MDIKNVEELSTFKSPILHQHINAWVNNGLITEVTIANDCNSYSAGEYFVLFNHNTYLYSKIQISSNKVWRYNNIVYAYKINQLLPIQDELSRQCEEEQESHSTCKRNRVARFPHLLGVNASKAYSR